MAVTYIPGTTANARARDSVNIDTGVTIPQTEYSVSKQIYVKNSDRAVLCKITEKLGAETGHDDAHRWKEDELVTQSGTLSSTVTVGATTLTFSNARMFTVNDILYNHEYQAAGLVTSVNTTTNQVVVSWISAPALAIPSDLTMVRIGNAYMEIDQREVGPSTIPVDHYNYYQDMRHGIAASDVHYEDVFRFKPDDWDLQLSKKLTEHELEREKTKLFGIRNSDTTGSTPRRTARGLYEFAATNKTSISGSVTRTNLDNFACGAIEANTERGHDWWFLCSGRIHRDISELANSLERTDTMAKQFGMAISLYKTPLGEVLKVVRHPLLYREGWNDMGFLLNMADRHFYSVWRGSLGRTKVHQVVQPYGRSAVERYVRSIETLVVKGEEINLHIMEDVTA